MSKIKILFLLVIASIVACSSVEEKYYSFQGFTQGTTYSIIYSSSDTVVYKSQIDSLLHQFDLSLSTYDSASLISIFNSGYSSVKADKLLKDVYLKAEEIYLLSNGAFDISIAPIVNAWGFGFATDSVIPDKQEIDSLLTFVGMDKLSLINDVLSKADPRMMIDVNAIAQGYSVDVVANYFESLGITNYMIEIGGELRGRGISHRGTPWKIGVDKPIENQILHSESNLQVVLYLDNKSLATSGNYRKFYEEDGIKYSHSIDPKTGYPVRKRLLSATILANDCITADAIATTCMIVGLDKAKELILNDDSLEAYLIYSGDNGEYLVWHTPAITDIIVPPKTN